MTDPIALVRSLAAARGFEVVGVTSAAPLAEALGPLRRWAENGYAGDMGYMSRNPPERTDARTLLKQVRTVISVAVNYYAQAPAFAAEGRFGRVARYAWGLDYHELVLPRLQALAEDCRQAFGGTKARAACDHSPFLERAAAARAGIGFFGKNTCLLLPRKGSWYFLGEVLLDIELPGTEPDTSDHCGTCVSCLPACPTHAFEEAFVLNATKCISYLTIEHRGAIPPTLRSQMGPWLFGCDVCQDVCPFNRFAQPTAWPELEPDRGVGPRIDVTDLLAIRDDKTFRQRFGATPLSRPKRRGLLRNAAIVARNVQATAAIPLLEQCVRNDSEPLVRQHALWALFGLDATRARSHAEYVATHDPDEAIRAEACEGLEGAHA